MGCNHFGLNGFAIFMVVGVIVVVICMYLCKVITKYMFPLIDGEDFVMDNDHHNFDSVDVMCKTDQNVPKTANNAGDNDLESLQVVEIVDDEVNVMLTKKPFRDQCTDLGDHNPSDPIQAVASDSIKEGEGGITTDEVLGIPEREELPETAASETTRVPEKEIESTDKVFEDGTSQTFYDATGMATRRLSTASSMERSCLGEGTAESRLDEQSTEGSLGDQETGGADAEGQDDENSESYEIEDVYITGLSVDEFGAASESYLSSITTQAEVHFSN